MKGEIKVRLPFKARWELCLLGIKVGHPFKSRLRIAFDGLLGLFFPKKMKAVFK